MHPAARAVLLIHGGAGVIRSDMDADTRKAVCASLREALERGQACLGQGGTALDAAVAAVAVLEDAPHFNAGRGAVFTHDGTQEMDAAVMDGATRGAGAVAGVGCVRNPVRLARAVMEHSPHVMLAGSGAEAFAREQGLELADPGYFRTEHRWQQLQQALAREPGSPGHEDAQDGGHYGTVGAVARDASGGLAAATSTGGMTNKRWGRVGDSPVIGAGTYADAQCAVSGTGWGEYFIRAAAAHAICMRVSAMRQPLREAAEEVVLRDIPQLGGDGGAIALGADGAFAMPFNTAGMYRGWIGGDGVPHVAIFADEEADGH